MKHYSTFLKLILTSILTVLMLTAVQSQVKQILYIAAHDVTIGSGTILNTHETCLDGGQLQMCNYDDNPACESYYESWIKFDFTTLEDSIPDGHQVLYAELKFRVSNNAGPQGAKFYHLYAIDDWLQEELTWDNAQDLNYETEGNFDQFAVLLPEDAGGTSARPAINVTEQVLYEMGDQGNKLLSIRCEPYVKDYIKDDPVLGKKWLGFYSREVTWDDPDPPNQYCPQITLWIGPEETKVFSDIENFGDIGNYTTTPSSYGYWLVRENEGDARLKICQRPAPINSTPGGVAVYNVQTYGDFDISLKAKLNKIKSGALDPAADFIIVFGYEHAMKYSYIRLTGEDINGFYHVDTTGGGNVVEVGTLNTSPAVGDTMFHNYRLVRSGNTVTASIDDAEYMSVTDAVLGAEGMIGVGSYNDIALFDDFQEGAGGPGAVNDLYQERFTVYPNPAQDYIYVNTDQSIRKLVITNIIGQEIMKLSTLNSGVTEINTSHMEPGVYFMRFYGSNDNPVTKKFIIK